MLASDSQNPEFSNPSNPDTILQVEFYDFAAEDKWKSQSSGIKTFKAECPFIRIAIPGNDKLTVERPADDADVKRFPKQWLYYQMKTGKIANAENVPGWQIDAWEELTEDQVRNLKHLRFYTVEQIAGANDAQIQGIGMGGQGLKTRAIAALEARNSIKTKDEIAKRDDQIAAQGKEIEELKAMMKQILEAQPKKKAA